MCSCLDLFHITHKLQSLFSWKSEEKFDQPDLLPFNHWPPACLASCLASSDNGAASDKNKHIRAMQPQSCIKKASIFTGSGIVPVLGAALEYSARVCFDEHRGSGNAVGEFFDFADDVNHVSYHIHCTARDEMVSLSEIFIVLKK
jgi:hypothetical protein